MKAVVVRPISLVGSLVCAATPVLLCGLNYAIYRPSFPYAAVVIYFGFMLISREVLTCAHRQGIRLVRRGLFADAIPHFEQSYSVMVRHPWIDRFRWSLIGSAGRWTYREMALCNIAFCHGQIGNGNLMLEFYRKALIEFPENILASTSLRMLNSIDGRNDETSQANQH